MLESVVRGSVAVLMSGVFDQLLDRLARLRLEQFHEELVVEARSPSRAMFGDRSVGISGKYIKSFMPERPSWVDLEK